MDDAIHDPLSRTCRWLVPPTPPQLPPAPPPTLPRRSVSIRDWKYDVFVSYRGEDIKGKFASHLFRAMRDRGIRYFQDNDRENRGLEVNWMLTDAIRHSRVALVALSPNYADSRWCLNELEEILSCHDIHKPDHVVHPIFLGVSTSHVRDLKKSFGEGFARSAAKNPDKTDTWKAALVRVANLAGWSLKNDANWDETKLIDLILDQLYDQFFYSRSSFFVKDPVPMKQGVEKVMSLLRADEPKDVKVIGVYGIKGTGKTTMMKIICGRIATKFDCFSFLENIRDANEEGLLNKLLHDIRKVQHKAMYYDLQSILNEIRLMMSRKRVLLVLDNVDQRDQVDLFLGDRKWLKSGSRILITTRYEYLLNNLKVDNKYMVSGLSGDESLQLFSRHAFSDDRPEVGYGELIKDILHYAGGLPLALSSLGSFLHKKTKDQWHDILEKLARYPHLDSVGIHLDPVSVTYPVKLGPCGNVFGGDSYDDKRYTGIRQIMVTVGSVIQSITVDYDQNGCLIRSTAYGGAGGGGATFTIKLDYPNEVLTSISGYLRQDCNPVVVQSLKFHSNYNRTYITTGEESGAYFACPSIGGSGKIIGLHGTYGCSLTSIGGYFEPVSRPYPFTFVGPYGGRGGETWNDGRYTDVRQIDIVFGSVIESITIWYDNSGCPISPVIHGKSSGGQTCSVKLDYPYEYLTSISGYSKGDGDEVAICSLTIESNLWSYGPVGTKDGDHFSFPKNGGKIVGFYGRSRDHLVSIGAYFEPVSHIHPFKIFGPFGGDCGNPWDDGRHSHIRQIFLTYRSVISSIRCVYDTTDGDIRETSHGGNGEMTYQIALDYPSEYIVSMAGYTVERDLYTVVTSLMFLSNRRMYGPFGSAEGTYFSLPSNSGKIVGFYGRSDSHLNAIGAHLEVYSNKLYPFKSVGPFGGWGPSSWDDGRFSHVVRIDIVVESTIRSIRFEYDMNGSFVGSQFHGASNGYGEIYSIKLDFPGEHLIGISGYTGDDLGSYSIRSLKFQSNKRTYGPFGTETGKYFSSPATGGKIVGFFGMSNSSHIVSIGAHFEPISELFPVQSIGPFGIQGQCFWSDGIFGGVKGITILLDNGISRIFVEYDRNGQSVWSSEYNESYRGKTVTIGLEYPNEYLTSISGYMNDASGSMTIQSLKFQTNKRRFGPYGKEKGIYFGYPPTGGKIVGFFGSCGIHLNSIGVYTAPVPHLYPFKSVGPFGGQGGSPWDDGAYTDVRQIKILYQYVIISIGIEYDNNGTPIPCSQHGGDRLYMGCNGEAEENGAKRPAKRFRRMAEPKMIQINLDYPKEYLVSISGFTGKKLSEEVVVQSLKITTNKRSYGAFGTPEGEPFQIPPSGGRIVGFYGRSGRFLNAFGARLEPF